MTGAVAYRPAWLSARGGLPPLARESATAATFAIAPRASHPMKAGPPGLPNSGLSVSLPTAAVEVSAIASRLLNLPLTSSEARELAARIWAFVEGLRSDPAYGTGAAGLEKAIEDFVAMVSEEFLFSNKDAAGLSEMLRDYAARFPIGAAGPFSTAAASAQPPLSG